jgi:K+ transporter
MSQKRTAIYAVANSAIVPQALLHNMKHNQVVASKEHFDDCRI